MFSKRSTLEDPPNALGRAVAEARQKTGFVDLTVSNPTDAQLPYDENAITAALASKKALVYHPEALGLPSARAAAAREHGVSPDAIAITASTSEAYGVLFKLLCDPDDEILVPAPSYPLLAWLAAFEGVVLKTYPLAYAGRWHVDLGELARAITPKTRAIVVVAPNNPTGSYLGKSELASMLDLGLPIISDEVFAKYPLQPLPADRVGSLLYAERGLVFVLSGLSKLVGLPQMKLGWIATNRPEVMDRIGTLLDAYLSVGAPVQHALPELLRAGEATRTAIQHRTRENLAFVRACLREAPAMNLLDVEGGWYATLRIPATASEEEWVLSLVESDGVYVHPGYFFDMHEGAHLVVSLLTPSESFREGMRRIVRRVSS